MKHEHAIAAIITKEEFCKIIDSVRDYWDTLTKLNKLLDTNIVESKLSSFMDTSLEFLNNLLYDKDTADKRDVNYINDIDYYCWELDFGRKYKPGVYKIDNMDIPLKNSEDLWNLIVAYESCDAQVVEI